MSRCSGFILKIPVWDQPIGDQIMDEQKFWDVASGYPDEEAPPHVENGKEASGLSTNPIANVTVI